MGFCTTGGVISGNTVRHTDNGIAAEGWAGGRIRGNTVRKSVSDGIGVFDSKRVNVLSNSSLGSGKFDCHQTGTGINTWTGNTGNTSKPAGSA